MDSNSRGGEFDLSIAAIMFAIAAICAWIGDQSFNIAGGVIIGLADTLLSIFPALSSCTIPFLTILYWSSRIISIICFAAALSICVYLLIKRIQRRYERKHRKDQSGQSTNQCSNSRYIRVDTKDFVDADLPNMNAKQITAYFDGLAKLINEVNNKGIKPDITTDDGKQDRQSKS